MISLSEKSKETASSLLNLLSTKDEGVSFSDSTPDVEILGNIYKLMVKKTVLDKSEDDSNDDKNDQRHFLANRRHKEILEALSFQPKPVPKVESAVPKEKKKTKKTGLKKTKTQTAKVTKIKTAEPKLKKVSTKKTEPTKKVAETKTEKPVTPAVVAATPVVPALAKGAVAAAGISVSAGALAKIKGSEGFRSSAYYDPKRDSSGKVLEEFYSVGYGHQITKDEIKKGYIMAGTKKIMVSGELGKNTVISKEDAETLVKQDFEKYEKYARSLPNFDKLNESAQTALIDMSYNMGVGWMSGNRWPSLRKQLEEMDMQGAAQNIRGSLYAKQVSGRAQKNADAIQNGLKNMPPTNIPSQNGMGSTIDNSSKQNQQLNQELNAVSSGTNTINQTNLNITQPQQQRTGSQSFDDMSAYERKSKIK